MPKISISGSHSTGKSTVINALKQDSDIVKRFTIKDEVLRDIKKLGYKINEFGTDETQRLVMAKFLEYSIFPDTILDRCALDGLTYTAYLYEKGFVRKGTLRIAEAIFENIKYDIQFYIPPEFQIVPDGIRSENEEFRNRVSEIFEEYIESYNIPIVYLKGNVDERVRQFKDTLDIYDKWLNQQVKAKAGFMSELKKIISEK